jgi:hypothetical protein
MELEFAEHEAVPRPPGEVRFLRITADPYEDGRRIKLAYELTPFQMRPDLEIRLEDEQGVDLGSISIVGSMSPRFTLTAHLRTEPPPNGRVLVRSVLGYEDQPEVDRAVTAVDFGAPRQREG